MELGNTFCTIFTSTNAAISRPNATVHWRNPNRKIRALVTNQKRSKMKTEYLRTRTMKTWKLIETSMESIDKDYSKNKR